MAGISGKLRIMLLSAAVLALGSGTALATDWTFTDLSLQGDIVGKSAAADINNNGDIVGIAVYAGEDYQHATLWRGGVAYDLGDLGYTSTAAAINDSGVIAGWANNHSISTMPVGNKAVIYSTSASPVVIHPAAAYYINSQSIVGDINNSGKMSGNVDTDLLGKVPVIWRDPETYTILDAGELGMGKVNRINNLGQAAGTIEVSRVYDTGYVGHWQSAAFWDADGTLTEIGRFGGYVSYAVGINDLGQVLVTGSDGNLNETWTLVWQDGEVVERLAGLGGGHTEANAINNNGLIVGQAQTADGVLRAVLWQDGEIIDLNDLVSGIDMVLENAIAINEQGQIVGFGDRDGVKCAFLLSPDLTPTPVPASLLLFGSGLAGLGVFRRRLGRG